jgi:AcrR family transcriptional regulator
LPKDKSISHARIIPAAKKEFLENGFEKASIRAIAASAGMTSAGLYRHFADKEEMFAVLVQPALDALKDLMEVQTRRAYLCLEKEDLDSMWSGDTDISRLVDVVYDHFDAFKLLLRLSAGTRFEHFFDEFVEIDQAETMRYMDALRARGIHVNDIVPEELHLLLNAYYSAFFEVVAHDFPRKDALHYLETLKQFFTPGWRAFLGF